MEQRAPPAERNELISHIDQSFVTGSCWRMVQMYKEFKAEEDK